MDLGWTLRRLKAMSREEVLWRISQKRLEHSEKAVFGKNKVAVTEEVFYSDVTDLSFHANRLPFAEYASAFCENIPPRRSIDLLGGYNYETYRTAWHAGFQTQNEWPLVFSYDLTYKQRDDIGDARTNWELNRHFQFALLAKAYHDTGDEQYLKELAELFEDWNRNNPFLWGISWTSVMEVAIRSINWMFTIGFLIDKIKDPSALTLKQKDLLNALSVGVINMTSYISAHFSQYSSANNHVIVEMAAVGIAGLCFEHEPWRDLATSVLNYEIPRQNHHDGVNKEQSLHYQAFFMEAVGLLMMTLKKNKRNVPMNWKYILSSMTDYLSDCRGYYGETIVFGDDDGGKILDLFHGEGRADYYGYVIQMMDAVFLHKKRIKPDAVCYSEGGVTLMHSKDHRAFLAIDHGPLGFGSIAAHGHADALSFQLYLDGEPIFIDPGTYIYHTDLESRNYFRSTACHNTITIDGKNQSEMLGPFLWGKRAETELLSFDSDQMVLKASHNGYAPVIHTRQFELQERKLLIHDYLESVSDPGHSFSWMLNYTVDTFTNTLQMQADEVIMRTKAGNVLRVSVFISQSMGTKDHKMCSATLEDAFLSLKYGDLLHTKQIRYMLTTEQGVFLTTEISWEQNE